jgi:hypothetical protein
LRRKPAMKRDAVRRSWLALLPLASIAALAGWSDLSSPPPAPAPKGTQAVPLTGEAVYLRAIHTMRAMPGPKYVIFRESVRTRNLTLSCSHGEADMGLRHGDASADYRVWLRVHDGEDVEVDLATGQRCDGASLMDPVESGTSKEDMFGPRPSPTPGQDTLAGPRLIAAVRTESARFYRITLAGTETFEGHPVYRLVLHAYRDPTDHPLTGLLVDTQSWLVRQASGEMSIHFVVASGWGGGYITFDEAGPYWVVRDEHVDVAANALLFHVRVALDAHASEFSFPDDLPASVFPSPRPTATAKSR